MSFREELRAADLAAIRALVARAKVFSAAEVEVAVEVASAALHAGASSGYVFCLAETS